jgi:PII-like signaling protein
VSRGTRRGLPGAEALKLAAYFGESERSGGRFVADALLDRFEAEGLAASVLLRGAEGFGARHGLRTDRLLSLSEDLPVVAVAVDSRARIEAALPGVAALGGRGLVTLERARLLDGDRLALAPEVAGPARAVKLTAWVGRHAAAGGAPAHLALVETLRESGFAGATVLLGVDGTVGGERRRARFIGANRDVPLMVIAVGSPAAAGAALPRLAGLPGPPLVALERAEVCKRDGVRLAAPAEVPEADDRGRPVWQKLTVWSGEQARAGRSPLHAALVRRLRSEGARGATTLRGIWGFSGDHAPHGDRPLALRRRVPLVTIVIDTPARTRRWWAAADELTPWTGLITSEAVPAVLTGELSGAAQALASPAT